MWSNKGQKETQKGMKKPKIWEDKKANKHNNEPR